MVTAAATPVPSPHAVDAVVTPIISERTLVVRLSDTASGYQRLCWREAWRALKSAENSGWRITCRHFGPMRRIVVVLLSPPSATIFGAEC